jgi:poly(A) polymerase Pap1
MFEESQKSSMPILTPVKPYQCTTFGMTKSSRKKIINEMIRARDICFIARNKRELVRIMGDCNRN